MNPQRGEVALEIGGETRRLCLTLGALAEIEHALGCETLKDLSLRMKAVSAADLEHLLKALLRGGGEMAASAQVHELAIHPTAALRAVLACFQGAVE